MFSIVSGGSRISRRWVGVDVEGGGATSAMATTFRKILYVKTLEASTVGGVPWGPPMKFYDKIIYFKGLYQILKSIHCFKVEIFINPH